MPLEPDKNPFYRTDSGLMVGAVEEPDADAFFNTSEQFFTSSIATPFVRSKNSS